MKAFPAEKRSATKCFKWQCWSPGWPSSMRPIRGSTSMPCGLLRAAFNSMRNAERSILLVTHYQRLLNHVAPDKVHVLVDGRIVKSGGKELAPGA